MSFLYTYLEDVYTQNVFTEGYGEERAFHDGKAKQAEEIYNILKGITND